ncbi:MAG: flavin reductase family protein [Pseudomonadota bacterium]
MAKTEIDIADWKGAMGYFPAGVTIITTWNGSAPIASTVSSFCSVSLAPPLLLFCLDQNNPILGPVKNSGRIGVNILDAQGGAAAFHFSKPGQNSVFGDYPYKTTDDGAPQLEAAPCFVDCTVEDTHLAGDHTIIVGKGVAIRKNTGAPVLIYHQGKFLNTGE